MNDEAGEKTHGQSWIGKIRLRCWRWVAQIFAQELLRELYLGVLDREPDPAGIAAYIEKPRRMGRAASVIADLLQSGEFREKSFAQFAPDMARAFHRGILHRDARPGGLEACTLKLSKKENLEAVLSGMVESDEFRYRSFAGFSPDLVNSVYKGLFGQRPEQEELAKFSARLAQEQDLAAILRECLSSEKFQRKSFPRLAPDLVRACYQGILKRDPDVTGLKTYAARLTKKEDLKGVLAEMIDSGEFKRLFTKPAPVPDPAITYHEQTWVFIHIEKTAGTALQNLLDQAFPPDTVLRGHATTLFDRSAGELSKYTVFAGHFDHDAISYIPRKSVSLLTMVREPKARLSSLYHFLRAHEPEHQSFGFEAKMANEAHMEEFYRDARIQEIFRDRMTWAVIGQRQWLEWQRHLVETGEPAFSEEFIATVVRTAMRKRLREFSFVGLQEDYDRSVELLFNVLGKPKPAALPREHGLELLTRVEPHFKRHVERQPITPACGQAMEEMIQLDNVLYQEAATLFHEQVAAQEQGEAPVIANTLYECIERGEA